MPLQVVLISMTVGWNYLFLKTPKVEILAISLSRRAARAAKLPIIPFHGNPRGATCTICRLYVHVPEKPPGACGASPHHSSYEYLANVSSVPVCLATTVTPDVSAVLVLISSPHQELDEWASDGG